VPKSTEDKVYSAVASPVTKVCLMMAHMWLKYVANRKMNVKVKDILKYFNNHF
jgi:hypothetical protein